VRVFAKFSRCLRRDETTAVFFEFPEEVELQNFGGFLWGVFWGWGGWGVGLGGGWWGFFFFVGGGGGGWLGGGGGFCGGGGGGVGGLGGGWGGGGY